MPISTYVNVGGARVRVTHVASIRERATPTPTRIRAAGDTDAGENQAPGGHGAGPPPTRTLTRPVTGPVRRSP
jgi:hypothetical protein